MTTAEQFQRGDFAGAPWFEMAVDPVKNFPCTMWVDVQNLVAVRQILWPDTRQSQDFIHSGPQPWTGGVIDPLPIFRSIMWLTMPNLLALGQVM